jgi:hypothetical protein
MIFNNDEHTDITYTYYSHDASGNVMATYNRSQRYLTALSVTEDYTSLLMLQRAGVLYKQMQVVI